MLRRFLPFHYDISVIDEGRTYGSYGIHWQLAWPHADWADHEFSSCSTQSRYIEIPVRHSLLHNFTVP
jgi:hypothetical protein